MQSDKENRLKIVSAGVKVLERKTKGTAESASDYRLLQVSNFYMSLCEDNNQKAHQLFIGWNHLYR